MADPNNPPNNPLPRVGGMVTRGQASNSTSNLATESEHDQDDNPEDSSIPRPSESSYDASQRDEQRRIESIVNVAMGAAMGPAITAALEPILIRIMAQINATSSNVGSSTTDVHMDMPGLERLDETMIMSNPTGSTGNPTLSQTSIDTSSSSVNESLYPSTPIGSNINSEISPVLPIPGRHPHIEERSVDIKSYKTTADATFKTVKEFCIKIDTQDISKRIKQFKSILCQNNLQSMLDGSRTQPVPTPYNAAGYTPRSLGIMNDPESIIQADDIFFFSHDKVRLYALICEFLHSDIHYLCMKEIKAQDGKKMYDVCIANLHGQTQREADKSRDNLFAYRLDPTKTLLRELNRLDELMTSYDHSHPHHLHDSEKVSILQKQILADPRQILQTVVVSQIKDTSLTYLDMTQALRVLVDALPASSQTIKLNAVSSKTTSSSPSTAAPCFEFAEKGTCKRGDSCRFAHVSSSPVFDPSKSKGKKGGAKTGKSTPPPPAALAPPIASGKTPRSYSNLKISDQAHAIIGPPSGKSKTTQNPYGFSKKQLVVVNALITNNMIATTDNKPAAVQHHTFYSLRANISSNSDNNSNIGDNNGDNENNDDNEENNNVNNLDNENNPNNNNVNNNRPFRSAYIQQYRLEDMEDREVIVRNERHTESWVSSRVSTLGMRPRQENPNSDSINRSSGPHRREFTPSASATSYATSKVDSTLGYNPTSPVDDTTPAYNPTSPVDDPPRQSSDSPGTPQDTPPPHLLPHVHTPQAYNHIDNIPSTDHRAVNLSYDMTDEHRGDGLTPGILSEAIRDYNEAPREEIDDRVRQQMAYIDIKTNSKLSGRNVPRSRNDGPPPSKRTVAYLHNAKNSGCYDSIRAPLLLLFGFVLDVFVWYSDTRPVTDSRDAIFHPTNEDWDLIFHLGQEYYGADLVQGGSYMYGPYSSDMEPFADNAINIYETNNPYIPVGMQDGIQHGYRSVVKEMVQYIIEIERLELNENLNAYSKEFLTWVLMFDFTSYVTMRLGARINIQGVAIDTEDAASFIHTEKSDIITELYHVMAGASAPIDGSEIHDTMIAIVAIMRPHPNREVCSVFAATRHMRMTRPLSHHQFYCSGSSIANAINSPLVRQIHRFRALERGQNEQALQPVPPRTGFARSRADFTRVTVNPVHPPRLHSSQLTRAEQFNMVQSGVNVIRRDIEMRRSGEWTKPADNTTGVTETINNIYLDSGATSTAVPKEEDVTDPQPCTNVIVNPAFGGNCIPTIEGIHTSSGTKAYVIEGLRDSLVSVSAVTDGGISGEPNICLFTNGSCSVYKASDALPALEHLRQLVPLMTGTRENNLYPIDNPAKYKEKVHNKTTLTHHLFVNTAKTTLPDTHTPALTYTIHDKAQSQIREHLFLKNASHSSLYEHVHAVCGHADGSAMEYFKAHNAGADYTNEDRDKPRGLCEACVLGGMAQTKTDHLRQHRPRPTYPGQQFAMDCFHVTFNSRRNYSYVDILICLFSRKIYPIFTKNRTATEIGQRLTILCDLHPEWRQIPNRTIVFDVDLSPYLTGPVKFIRVDPETSYQSPEFLGVLADQGYTIERTPPRDKHAGGVAERAIGLVTLKTNVVMLSQSPPVPPSFWDHAMQYVCDTLSFTYNTVIKTSPHYLLTQTHVPIKYLHAFWSACWVHIPLKNVRASSVNPVPIRPVC